MPGARVVLCEAPPSCRVQHFGPSRPWLHGPPESNERIEVYDKDPSKYLIHTPTSSAAFDTMPSTPTEAWPRGAGERHTPPPQHMPNAPNVYPSYQQPEVMQPPLMPVLRLSEVLPGQQHLMGPGLRQVQEPPPGQFQMPQMLQKPMLHCDSTSASGGSVSLEGYETATRGFASPDLPSRGSALHAWRACKPCAFVFNEEEGCGNGVDCEFCHLCEPGERKRRKKERKVQKREARDDFRGIR